MAHVWLQAIQRQNDPPLRLHPRRPPRVIGEMDREELLVAIDEVRHRALGNAHAALHEMAVDLRHAAVIGLAQAPDQRDHIQAKGAPRQRPVPFLFRAIRLMIERACRILAPPHR